MIDSTVRVYHIYTDRLQYDYLLLRLEYKIVIVRCELTVKDAFRKEPKINRHRLLKPEAVTQFFSLMT